MYVRRCPRTHINRDGLIIPPSNFLSEHVLFPTLRHIYFQYYSGVNHLLIKISQVSKKEFSIDRDKRCFSCRLNSNVPRDALQLLPHSCRPRSRAPVEDFSRLINNNNIVLYARCCRK